MVCYFFWTTHSITHFSGAAERTEQLYTRKKKMDQALPLTRDFILYVFWRIIREEHEEKSY